MSPVCSAEIPLNLVPGLDVGGRGEFIERATLGADQKLPATQPSLMTVITTSSRFGQHHRGQHVHSRWIPCKCAFTVQGISRT